jgi:DNA-directed RNA polymerase subunit RPC12/RpoP
MTNIFYRKPSSSKLYFRFTHPLSNKTYFGVIDDFAKILAKAEYEYQMSLPPEKRAKKQSSDFACPYCKTKTKPTVIKKVITECFFILFKKSYLVNIYKCVKCESEFTEEDLIVEKKKVDKNNYNALLVERYKKLLKVKK